MFPITADAPAKQSETEISKIISELKESIRRKFKRVDIFQMAEKEKIPVKEIIEAFKKHIDPKDSIEEKQQVKGLQKVFQKWYDSFRQRRLEEGRREHKEAVNREIKNQSNSAYNEVFRQCMRNSLSKRSAATRCVAIKLLAKSYPK